MRDYTSRVSQTSRHYSLWCSGGSSGAKQLASQFSCHIFPRPRNRRQKHVKSSSILPLTYKETGRSCNVCVGRAGSDAMAATQHAEPAWRKEARGKKHLQRKFRTNAKLFFFFRTERSRIQILFSIQQTFVFRWLSEYVLCIYLSASQRRHTRNLSTFPRKLPFSCVFGCGFSFRPRFCDGCDV